jgi:hypothetical protein
MKSALGYEGLAAGRRPNRWNQVASDICFENVTQNTGF